MECPSTMDLDTAYLPGLSPVEGKRVQASFDDGLLSSDGGLLLLCEVERKLGIAERLAACLALYADVPKGTDFGIGDATAGTRSVAGGKMAFSGGFSVYLNNMRTTSVGCDSEFRTIASRDLGPRIYDIR